MGEGAVLGTAIVNLVFNKGNMASDLSGIAKSTNASIGGITKTISKLAGVGVGLYAVKQAVMTVHKAFVDFDRDMHNVWTLTDQTSEQVAALSSELRALAWQYNVTSSEAAKAMYQIYSATFYGADAMKILESSARGAAAGLTDVFTAANMGTTVLNAYRMEAEEIAHVNDLLFTAVRFGKTTYGELASQFGRLAGVAAPIGASVEEMTAAIATLTRQGIATDWAVTSLRQTLMKMLQPTKELERAINDIGFTSGGAMVKAYGFADSLGKIKVWAEQNGVALDKMFTNVRAVTAVLPLATTAAGEFAKDLQRMSDAGGAADAAFFKQTGSWAYQLEILKTRLNDVGITLGKLVTPAMAGFLDGVLALLRPIGLLAEGLNVIGGDKLLRYTVTIGVWTAGIVGLAKAYMVLNKAMSAMILKAGVAAGVSSNIASTLGGSTAGGMAAAAAGGINMAFAPTAGTAVGGALSSIGQMSKLKALGLGAAGLGAIALTLKAVFDLELVMGQVIGGEEVKGALKASLEMALGPMIGGAVFGRMILGKALGAAAGAGIGVAIGTAITASLVIYHIIKKESGDYSDLKDVAREQAGYLNLPANVSSETDKSVADLIYEASEQLQAAGEQGRNAAQAIFRELYDVVGSWGGETTASLQGKYRGVSTLAGATGLVFPADDVEALGEAWKQSLADKAAGAVADLSAAVRENLPKEIIDGLEDAAKKAKEELDEFELPAFGEYMLDVISDWAKDVDMSKTEEQLSQYANMLTGALDAFNDIPEGDAAAADSVAKKFKKVLEAFAEFTDGMGNEERIASFFKMIPDIAQEYYEELGEAMSLESADAVTFFMNKFREELGIPLEDFLPQSVATQIANTKEDFYELFEELKSGDLTLEQSTTKLEELRAAAEKLSTEADDAEALQMDYAASVRAAADELDDVIAGLDSASGKLDMFATALNNVALAAGAGSKIQTLFEGLEQQLLSSTNMGDAAAVVSAMMSGASTVESFTTNLEKIFGPGSEWSAETQDFARAMHALAVDTVPEFGMSIEEVISENKRLATEHKNAADKAQREAEQMAADSYRAEQEAFRSQFLDPIIRGMRTGDFEGAAAELNGLTARFQELAAIAAPLGIDAGDLLGMMTGARSQLLSMIDGMIEINKTMPELVASLQGARVRIVSMFEGEGTGLQAELDKFTTASLLDGPRELARTLQELAEQDVVLVSEKVNELTGKITEQTEAMARMGLQNIAASTALAEFESELSGVPIHLQGFTDALDKHANTINELANELLPEGMAAIIGKMMTFFQRLGVVKSDFPVMAEGGITTGATFAMIGEAGPEAIIPLAQLPQIMQSFGGDNAAAGPFPTNISMGGFTQIESSMAEKMAAVVDRMLKVAMSFVVSVQKTTSMIDASLTAFGRTIATGTQLDIPMQDILDYGTTTPNLESLLGPAGGEGATTIEDKLDKLATSLEVSTAAAGVAALPMTAVPTLDTYEPIDTQALCDAISLAIKDAFAGLDFVWPEPEDETKDPKLTPDDEKIPSWQDAIKMMGEGLKQIFSGDVGGGMDLLGQGMNAFMDSNALAAVSGGVAIVSEVVSQMKTLADEAIKMVTDAMKKLGDFVLPVLQDSFSGLINSVKNVVGSLKSLITSTKTYQDLQSSYSGLISNVFNSLLGFLLPIIGVFDMLNKTVEETIDDFSDLNVPTGYKVGAEEWKAATPGEPGDLRGDSDTSDGPQWVTDLLEEFGEAIQDAIVPFTAFFDIMGEVWKELGPVIMEGLLPSLKKFGESLLTIGEHIQTDLLPVLQEHLAGTISGLLDFAFGAVLGGLTFIVDTLIATMPNIELFAESLGRIGDALPEFAAALSEGVSPAINTLLVGLTSLSDWITETLIPDMSVFAIGFGKMWTEQIGPFVEGDVFTKIGETGTWLYEKLGEIITFFETKVWDFIEGDFWDAISEVITKVTDALDDILPMLEDNWPAVMEYILGVIEDFGIDIVGMIDLAQVGFLHKIGETGEAIKLLWESESVSLWDKLKISMGLGLDSLWTNVKDMLGPSFEGLIESLGNLLVALDPIWKLLGGAMWLILKGFEIAMTNLSIIFDILAVAINIVLYPFKCLGVAIHNLIEFIKHPFAPGKRDTWEPPSLLGDKKEDKKDTPAAATASTPTASTPSTPSVSKPTSPAPATPDVPTTTGTWSGTKYTTGPFSGLDIYKMLSSFGIGSGVANAIAGGWTGAGMSEMQFAMMLGSTSSKAGLKSKLGSGSAGVGGIPTWPGFSVPGLRYGGKLLTDGLVFGHQDEILAPARVSTLPTNTGSDKPIEIVTHVNLIADGRTLAKVVTREKRHQEKLMTGSSNGRRWERVN